MPGYLRTFDGQERPIGRLSRPIECFRCGVCCVRYQPGLTDEEIEAIAKGLDLSGPDFRRQYVMETLVGSLLARGPEGCIFLAREDDTGLSICRIYPFRPEACRDWSASLSRPECREGLARRKSRDIIMRVEELYPSSEARDYFYSALG